VLRWWETKTKLRRSASLTLACVLGIGVACGGNSARHGQSAGGVAARSGTGGDGGAGASAGASGGSSGINGARGGGVGTGAVAAGTGGDAAGTSGAPASGNAGVATTLGGSSGSGAGMAGGGGVSLAGGTGSGAVSGAEASAGADQAGAGPCVDFCKPDAPACCSDALRCMPGVQACRIDVLADRVDPQEYYDDLVAKVALLSSDIALSIGDVEIAQPAMDPPPAARIELDLTAQASATHGPALKKLLNHPFRVACDGEELYIGVVYIREGAAALLTPVLHVEDADDGTLRVLLGAAEGEWTGLGGFSTPEENERLDHPELRAALCARGILSELPPR